MIKYALNITNSIKLKSCLFLLICLSFWFATDVSAQTAGAVTGKITDSQTGEELPGTTVRLKGTSKGAVTDIYGEYLITIPVGEQVLTFNFLGYAMQEITVNVVAGTFTELNVQMQPDVLQMEEIVVTGQALGQMAAINQQINAKSIVNVVSKDKIESLPDQNAAESVGRLPGISIRREGGEGQQVVVRGLSPRFNAITINGERIPSSSAVDRSFDLSTLSADALQGIEVYKSWTPNLEGDAIGGTVNFITKKAQSGWSGSIRYLHGYNGQQDELGQHRINGDIGNRFLKDKLGVILSGNFQRADRSQDRISRDFQSVEVIGGAQEALGFVNINLEDRLETRDRFGGTVSLDYTLDKGEIRLFSNFSQTNRDQLRRRRRYRWDSRRQEYEIIAEQTENSLLANTLSGNYLLFSKLELLWSGSYSQTRIRTPFNNSLRFRQNSAYNIDPSILIPSEEQILEFASNDLSETFLQRGLSDEDDIDFDRITGQIDMKYPVSFGDQIKGTIQGGGKVRLDNRTRDLRRFQARPSTLVTIAQDNPDAFIVRDDEILIENFFGDFVAADFYDGEYFLGPGSGRVNGGHLDENIANDFLATYLPSYQRNLFADAGDYEVEENITSFYAMIDFNIASKLNILMGIRNETTDLTYTGFEVTASASEAEVDLGDDPLVFLAENKRSRNYSEWLPAVNLKYNVNSWFDIRAAVTKTLSRPNFQFLVPFVRTNKDQQELERGNFDLQHQTSWNYDLFLSFYNKFGLLTIGGFLKQIDNIDFIRTSVVTSITPNTTPDVNGFDLIQPENAVGITDVQGIEIDFQANLTSLPSPWNGVVFSANATFIDSETFYPVVTQARNPIRPVLGVREGSLVGQPDEVYNVSLGYERGGFSGRVSMIHQANVFGILGNNQGDELGGLNSEIDNNAQLDRFTGRTTRLDLSFSQKVRKNLKVIFNANNITNQRETAFISDRELSNGLIEGQIFGMTLDLGLQYKF
ncbi:MAG: TonB-dependent receptor [Bacteroidota bacterium]